MSPPKNSRPNASGKLSIAALDTRCLLVEVAVLLYDRQRIPDDPCSKVAVIEQAIDSIGNVFWIAFDKIGAFIVRYQFVIVRQVDQHVASLARHGLDQRLRHAVRSRNRDRNLRGPIIFRHLGMRHSPAEPDAFSNPEVVDTADNLRAVF